MSRLAAWFICLLSALVARPSGETPVTVLTPQVLTNLNVQVRQYFMDGEFQKYADLIPEDFTGTTDWSEIGIEAVKTYDRAGFLAGYKDSLRQAVTKSYETKIEKITFSADGRKASVEGSVFCTGVLRADGSTYRCKAAESVTVEIRRGRIMITGLHAVGKEYDIAPPPADKKPPPGDF